MKGTFLKMSENVKILPQLRLPGPHASLGADSGDRPLTRNQMSTERRKKKKKTAKHLGLTVLLI